MYLRIPLPKGEGAAKRRVRGTKMKNMKQRTVVPLTGPAGAGHPLPSGEGFAKCIFQFAQHSRPGGVAAGVVVHGTLSIIADVGEAHRLNLRRRLVKNLQGCCAFFEPPPCSLRSPPSWPGGAILIGDDSTAARLRLQGQWRLPLRPAWVS